MKRLWILICIVLCVGCEAIPVGPRNHKPQAGLTVTDDEINRGDSAEVLCQAVDPDGDPITFEWWAEGGSLVALAPDRVRWSAPLDVPTEGKWYVIACRVEDAFSAEDVVDVAVWVRGSDFPWAPELRGAK